MSFDRVLRFIIIGGIFLVPLIPFIVTNSTFFPFITGKNFFFRILVEVTFASWILLALRNVAYRPTFNWLLVSVLSFVGIIALADALGADPSKSFWSNFERMEGLVTLVHLLLYFVVLGTVFNSQKMWNAFLNTTVGASVIMGIFGLFQLSGTLVINQGGIRLDGRFGNATYFAVYMLFHVFITAFLLLRWRGGNFVRYLYGAIILLQLTILYYTATRGAILGFLGGALLASILTMAFEREKPIFKKIGVSMLVGVVLIIGGFIAIQDTNFVKESNVLRRFAGISVSGGDVETRFTIWSMAWEGVKERPILGWGQENFNLIFNKQYKPTLYGQEPWFDRVHNIVFDWLVAGGILGLLAYISMPLLLLYYLWFKEHEILSVLEKSLLTGMLAAYGFHNLFVFDNIISYILFFTILAYVYSLTRPREATGWLAKEISQGTVERLFTPIVIIVLVFSVYFVNTKGMLASQTLLQSLRDHPEGLVRNMQFFREAVAYNSFGNQEIREQAIQFSSRLRNLQGVDPAIREEAFNFARSEMEKQIDESAPDARLELFLATLLDAYELYDDAAVHYERAYEQSPQKQTLRFALGSNYLNRNENDKALALFKETVELDPRYDEAHIMYATAALYSQQPELADQILLDHFGTSVIINNRLIRAYADLAMYQKLIDVWKLRFEQNPGNVQFGVALAAAYLQSGDRAESIATLEGLIEAFPDFAAQGQQFIDEIRAGRNP